MSSFVTHALAARLEAVEVTQLSALARIAAERVPAQGAAAIPIAGGVASFVGRHISLSRAAGLGMAGPVSAADLDALEDFYRSRGTEARILVSPFAHPSLFELLGGRGFPLVELDTMLIRRLDGAEHFPVGTPAVEVNVATPDDAAAWVAASMEGFGVADAENARERVTLFESAFHMADTTYLTATIDGAIAGTAALFVHGNTAYLFAASTGPAFRGRGVQSALIQARLALARDAGCDLAFSGAGPGTASQRNFERRGFTPVYSQALLIKRYPGA